jgi:two-component system, NtrC family, sensor kinase
VNTPLGIALTAASHLKGEFDMTKESLSTEKVEIAEEIFDILLRNLRRATAVVESFRQVTIDEVADEIVDCKLKQLVVESVESLRPRLEKRNVAVDVVGDDGRLRTYAGSIYPIVTNLIVNSLTHAYANGGGGLVVMTIGSTTGGVSLTYHDDGVGMSESTRKRVFEPFYTTNRSAGGTGLGMYAVYNTVTHKLGGSITVASEPGEGTTVSIELPSLKRT